MAFPSCCFPYDDSWNISHSRLFVPKNGSRITQGALSILRNRAARSLFSLMALVPVGVIGKGGVHGFDKGFGGLFAVLGGVPVKGFVSVGFGVAKGVKV